MRVDIGDGVRLYFDTWGHEWVADGDRLRQRPTLLLLHGGPGFDHSTYRKQFGRLADLAHVVAYDHRSQGRSDERPTDEWTLDVWADDVVRFCAALEIERPIVLGNSFGGMVALHYGARHPGHARGIVLSSTATHLDVDLIAGWFERLGGPEEAELARRFWTDPTPEHASAYIDACGGLYTQSAGNVLADPLTVRRAEVTAHFIGTIQPTMDLRGDLPRLACPTLVLAGGLDPVCPIEVNRELASLIPAEHRRFEVFEDCGHGVFRDDPDRAFAALRAFVAEVIGPG